MMVVTHNIPGGWAGNEPGWYATDPCRGNVLIDPRRIVLAVTWLRRRAEILSTRVYLGSGEPAILLTYRLRRKRAAS